MTDDNKTTLAATLPPNRFDCAECGRAVKADEDGCCSSCGRDCAVFVDGKQIDGPTPAPALDLDAAERPTPITDEQLAAWRAVAGAASLDAFQYGASSGDGRAFVLDCYDKGPSGPVHTVWFGDPDDAAIVAVTGNGPTSAANAKHFAWSSPRNVTALIDEVRALRAAIAEAKRLGRELVAALPEHARDCGINNGRIDTCNCHALIAAALEAL